MPPSKPPPAEKKAEAPFDNPRADLITIYWEPFTDGVVPSSSPLMPLSEPTHSENLAKAPFDDAQADVILQSNDGVRFHVFKNILSLASPIFNDMFNLPSPPPQGPNDEFQVVPLSEHSTVLDIALRHIYPVRPPRAADTLQYASILAEFARKYQVEALDNCITGYLMDNVERDPVGVYAIAVTYEFNGIGENAARTCLNLPFSGLKSPYMRCMAAEHISELLRYHVACGEAASALASSDRTWFSSLSKNGIITHQRSGRISCRSCHILDFTVQASEDDGSDSDSSSDERQRSGPRCLWNYLYRSALVLAHHPSAAIATEDFVLKSNNCRSGSCAQSMRGDMIEIGVVLGREVKNAVQRVSLSLYPLSHVGSVQLCMVILDRFPYPRLFP